MSSKIILYQVFPRLLTNAVQRNMPNGSLQENGCGKLNDITLPYLKRVKANGFTHIWYTGLLEHATQTRYDAFGIRPDTPCIVKGKAGSPYAIKDYYDIDPDLCTNPNCRMAEFEQLVERTHKAGLGMIIDFVPNHVAREYHSDAKPAGVADLGEHDNRQKDFDPQNNFYYLPGQPLQLNFIPQSCHGATYTETPAKATGNDQFSPAPGAYDWYETIKLNYGVDYCHGRNCHFDPVPDTWKKMLHILLFWAGKGIDGFRCDMAEMVPCEFWHWCIPQVKAAHPTLLFIAEVYNPAQYRNYIEYGQFDYLYDKVGLYDTLRVVCTGHAPANHITRCWQQLQDLQPHMLNFLENHDEQRIASDFFCRDARKALPALVVSCCMNINPVMIYAGQEVGERGMNEEGFSGLDGRTTIFDYWHVDSLYRLYKGERHLNAQQRTLLRYYRRVLLAASREPALAEGDFFDLMYVNHSGNGFDDSRMYAFMRAGGNDAIIAVANFGDADCTCKICIPEHAFTCLRLTEGSREAHDLLHDAPPQKLTLHPGQSTEIHVAAHDAVLLKFSR